MPTQEEYIEALQGQPKPAPYMPLPPTGQSIPDIFNQLRLNQQTFHTPAPTVPEQLGDIASKTAQAGKAFLTAPINMVNDLYGKVAAQQQAANNPSTSSDVYTDPNIVAKDPDVPAAALNMIGLGTPFAQLNSLGMAGGRGFGKGWWFDLNQRKLHEIDHGELGPHGDHDGWIAIAENAQKLGVDPKKAAAFQVANYGAWPESKNTYVNAFHQLHPERSAHDYEDINTGRKFTKEEHKQYSDDFQKIFGMDPNVAGDTTQFNNLVRVRDWGHGILSLTETPNIGSPARFVDSLLKENPTILDGVKTVVLDNKKMDVPTFLEGKWEPE